MSELFLKWYVIVALILLFICSVHGRAFADEDLRGSMRYPHAFAYMYAQSEYQDPFVFHAKIFNLWMRRLGLAPCAVTGERVDRCLQRMENHLTPHKKLRQQERSWVWRNH